MISRRPLAFLSIAAALLLCVPAAAAPVASDARLAALARDVDRVESVRAVKRLQIAWASYVDLGEWDRAAALFTDDAELAHADDRFRGRAEILAYFRRMIGKGSDGLPANTIHTPYLMMPVVTLAPDGNSAKGRWRAMSMRGALGGDASWQGGIFENEYVRVGGAWKISRQIFTPLLLGPYETGWRGFRPVMPQVPYHFQPEDVGRPAALGPDVAATEPANLSFAALAGRIQALDDEAAVRNLQDAYGYYVDFKMWDDVVDLFAPAGSLSIAGVGTYQGAKGIRRALERDGPAGLRYGEMNDHVQADVIVEVAPDGLHARARGLDLGMIGRNEGEAYWLLTRFDNLFVKQGGRWRFDRMRKATWMRTPYSQGWGKSWLLATTSEAEARPDGPAAALPAIWQLERPAPAARSVAGTSLARAEASLRAAAAYDAAENLAGGYGSYLDDNHWDELGALFAARGERDSAGGGFIRTPERIAWFSRRRYGPFNPKRAGGNMHMRTQPVIHVAADGRTAQIRTRLFQMTIPAPDSPRPPMFVTGMYEDDLLFEEGAWRFKRVDIDHLVYAPYPTGWTGIKEGAGAAMTPSLASVADVTFDAPGAGDTHPAFPRLPHMWFHYRNPVSGRAPPYLMPKYPLPEP